MTGGAPLRAFTEKPIASGNGLLCVENIMIRQWVIVLKDKPGVAVSIHDSRLSALVAQLESGRRANTIVEEL